MKLLTELNIDGTTIVMVAHTATDAEKAQSTVHLCGGHVVNWNIKKVFAVN